MWSRVADKDVLTGSRRGVLEPIAILGIGCRFPGARGPEAFWQLLREGRDAITEVPASRFDIDTFYDPRPATPGRICTRQGGFLEGVDLFDPTFFGISPREAVRMDPQHRMLLELAWEALEDAGQVPERLVDAPVGVFVGMAYNDYEDLQFSDPESYDLHSLVGGFRSAAAGRIARSLGLRGPSFAVDAACASSLVAVHLACQSLWSGECEMALACGANLFLEPQLAIGFSQGRMLAPDGRCKFCDSRADGFVRSEGIGVLVLKRLSRAQADGDPAYACILGSATNNDGASGRSMMSPGREGQEDLLRQAYRRAGVAPGQVDYVEAHGTGTPVGDRVEVGALAAVLGPGRTADRPLLVGSVKTNIGHAEGAAGIAGLVKLALSLRHGEIPPSLHVRELTPEIPWSDLPVAVQRQLAPWPVTEGLRLGSVNSFGINGSNAHVIMEEAPPAPEATLPGRPVQVLPVSARTPQALSSLVQAWRDVLGTGGAAPVADLCYTASVRRTHHEHRLAVVGCSPEELAERLDAFLAGESRPGTSSGAAAGTRPRIAFLFSGQGSQWLGMGVELMAQEPVFRAAIEACDREIREQAGWSLLDELQADEARSRLEEVDVVQPALFSMQVALAALWRSWGVEPDAIVGQSMGEIAAAHVAGALDLSSAVRVVCSRSRLVKSAGGGRMATVELSLEEARQAVEGCRDLVSVAVSSGPRSTVLSGDGDALRTVLDQLQARGVFCRWINVDYASHCPQMNPLCADFSRALTGLAPGPSQVPIYSTVTGSLVDGTELDASYWVRNLREPVLFAGCLRKALDDGHTAFLEISAHPVLLVSLQQAFHHWGEMGVLGLPSTRREDELATLLGSLGALYTAGYPVAWPRLHPDGGRCVTAPTYPWQWESFWLDHSTPGRLPDLSGTRREAGSTRSLLGSHFRSAAHAGTHFWETSLRLRESAWLADHRVEGTVVLPAAACLEMALAAAAEACPGSLHTLEARFEKALFLPEDRPVKVQLVLETGAEPASFRLYSEEEDAQGEAAWKLHTAGVVHRRGPDGAMPASESRENVRLRCPEAIPADRLYRLLEERGLAYGPSFRGVEQLFLGEREALAEIRLPVELSAAAPSRSFQVHPVLLDSCFQVLAFLATDGGNAPVCWPVSLASFRSYGTPGDALWCHAVARPGREGGLAGDVTLLDESGRVVLQARDLDLQPLAGSASRSAGRGLEDLLYRLEWRTVPAEDPLADAERQGWIVLADTAGLGDELAGRLEALGEPCLVVRSGGESLDRQEVCRQLASRAAGLFGSRCRGVVHLWGLDAAPASGASAADLEEAVLQGCLGAVHLVQALAGPGASGLPRLFFVTRSAQSVTGEPSEVTQSCLWGLGRVLACEHQESRCCLIDLAPQGGTDEVARLLADIRSKGRETQVAYRGGERYAARLVPFSPAESGDTGPVVRPDGSYLITGGLGALGLAVAEWLVGQGGRHVALLGRRGPSAAAREVIARLETAGAEIAVVQADVADPAQLAAGLAEIGRRLPPLRGVVHAAGLLEDKTVLELDRERLLAVLRPKVTGAWNLHTLTAGSSLDFFVLFSSAMGLLGSPGQGNYAAASACLDGLAHHRRAHGLPALSIDWGPWSEVGLAAVPGRGERLHRRGVGVLSPEQGIALFRQLLGSNEAQLAAMVFDAEQWREFYPVAGSQPLFEPLWRRSSAPVGEPGSGAAPGVSREALAEAPPMERRERVELYLQRLLARVLGLPAAKVEAERPITRMGIDSLMAVEVRNRVEVDLGLTVTMVSLLRGPTLGQLTDQLLDDLALEAAAHEQGAAISESAPGLGRYLEEVRGLDEGQMDALLADLLAEERAEEGRAL